MMKTITASDGHTLECWFQPAEGTPRGGLVILQEIFGVTEQLKSVARRYAALGFEVAIPALFDRQRTGAVVAFDDIATARSLMQGADPAKAMLDIDAAVSALADQGKAPALRVAVMGFCWGGGLAVRAAQELNIAGAVVFYGTRLPAYFGTPVRAPVQGHFGESDDHTPADVLEAAQAEWPELEVFLYPAGHAFANEERPQVHDPEATAVAHERSAAFLARVTG